MTGPGAGGAVPGVPGPPAELRETHSAVILLTGEHAYKFKKPVQLAFLDFRTEQSRARASRRELELNRRLAPDVYLDVVRVVGARGHGYEHGIVMRRMPEQLRLSRLVADAAPGLDTQLGAVAAVLARFHRRAQRGPQIAAAGGVEGLRRRWRDNLRECEPYRGGLLADGLHEQITGLVARYLDGRGPLLAARVAAGLIVDGHGDLLAEDIFCLPDYPRLLDCLDFDDTLRYVDVLDDAAFLAMDLEVLGRPDLAELFLTSYLTASGTADLPSLRHHYLAYRAFVRAKVLCVRAGQGAPEAPAAADRHARLAVAHLRAGEVRLILVGGPPGSGKTTLARGLAGALGARVLSTDTIRAGLNQPAEARYRAAAKEQTYRALLAQAGTALQQGESVIADATWGERRVREWAEQLAATTSSRLTAVECRAPVEVAVARAGLRQAAGGDASEAGAEVARRLARERDPWPGAVTVDTGVGEAAAVAAALSALGPAPG